MINLTEYIIEKLRIDKDTEIDNNKILKSEGNGDDCTLRGFLFNSWNSGRFTFMSEYCKYFVKHADEFNINDNDITSLDLLSRNLKDSNIKSLKTSWNQKIIYDIINCVLKYNIGPLTIPRTNKLKKMLDELTTDDVEVLKNNLTWGNE